MREWGVVLGRGVFCVLLFLLIGEFDFRVMPHALPLRLEAAEWVCRRFGANQVGFVWLGVMTRRSVPAAINAQGLRGAEVDLNAIGRLRILGVGSSSAFGAGVHDDETWAFQLQTLLRQAGPPADVLNAGVPGWSTFQIATFIKSYSSLYRPHAIVVMVTEKQLERPPGVNEPEKQNYPVSGREAKTLSPYYPRFVGYLKGKIGFICKIKRAEMNTALARFSGEVAEKVLSQRLQKQTLYWQSITVFADSQKVPTIFFIPNLFGSATSERLGQSLRDLTQASPWVSVVMLSPDDLTERDQRSSPAAIKASLTIPGDGHPNARYHRLIAEKLAGVFERLNMNALP
jgi:hypothetical protein